MHQLLLGDSLEFFRFLLELLVYVITIVIVAIKFQQRMEYRLRSISDWQQSHDKLRDKHIEEAEERDHRIQSLEIMAARREQAEIDIMRSLSEIKDVLNTLLSRRRTP